ncbi:tRNA dihydrouridine(20/20a) synthase DusA [Jannaschia aquimarina]|uniref:tRNA-dihydrouridine(20/20a) synthase n=1 Tax=Jannaschia aquimarina TaxID=935700 RepID=A0A0D1D6R1_9RHOB|nr:tRNA dihydrouridine(20/20a) synthase DusA [Jannaschia aquimarina]KIT15653.1 putative tRNA-dihydrouridine synthase [Jannaschia aquimarina]SNT03566.1 tRNA-U16,U17-dihydrouridine synthase [Jannaschia aquimarina]
MPLNAATKAARLSTAPMMDWTDRHCRALHRVLSRQALLYTEMVTSAALVRGGATSLLAFDPKEQPVALQIGGSDPVELAEATSLGVAEGYAEINLNVGCPSDRVQSGCFGAILMTRPALVADCVTSMIEAAGPVPVTVKCRIGVDEQDPHTVLPDFLARMRDAGIRRVAIHARKAWLQGLSPKENREVPPLDYPLVYEMKARFPDLHLSINGGVPDLSAAETHLRHVDGVMIGRAAYHDPANVLMQADSRIFGAPDPCADRQAAALAMVPYIEAHLADGGKLSHVTRHMLGLFAGLPGARGWRRTLSEEANRPGAGVDVLFRALAHVTEAAA